MKKVIILLSIFILISGQVNAQIDIGLKGGLNFSTLSDGDSWENKTAFHAGVAFVYMFTKNLGIQPELLYSSQGSDYSEVDFQGSYNLDYLVIPILVRYMILENLYAVAGPRIAFLLSAEDDYTTGSMDIKDFMNSTDLALVMGLMYRLYGMDIYTRYALGLTEVQDQESYKTRLFQFGISYNIFTLNP